jgi:histidine triad (HIT) family protein
MASVFTRIIRGELPARFVWKDERCVAFLSINPLRPGHTLVVSRDEIDHWLDLPADLLAHLARVAQEIGQAIQAAFRPSRVAVMLVGLEVPHVHIHLVPIQRMGDVDFANAERDPRAEDLDRAANALRDALRRRGAKHIADG